MAGVVAFEVRHLVEHCDGKPDSRFRDNVRNHRGGSTWGRRQDLNAAEKVHVEDEDVAITYEAMLSVTGVVSAMVLARLQ
jgi:hypothetical protein